MNIVNLWKVINCVKIVKIEIKKANKEANVSSSKFANCDLKNNNMIDEIYSFENIVADYSDISIRFIDFLETVEFCKI